MALPQTDNYRSLAAGVLGSGLKSAGFPEAALQVLEATLTVMRREFPDETTDILSIQTNISTCYSALERYDEVLRIRREVYAARLARLGPDNAQTIQNGCNLVAALLQNSLYDEAKLFARKNYRAARRGLGDVCDGIIFATESYAAALKAAPGASRADVLKAEQLLVNLVAPARHVFGPSHPDFHGLVDTLEDARQRLRML